MWAYDLDLWPWRSWRLWLMRVVVLHPYTKFEVRIRLGIRKIWRTMCVGIKVHVGVFLFSLYISVVFFVLSPACIFWRINVVIKWPGDLDLWPFDLETGMRVLSKVGNLPSRFGHARPFVSRIIRYVRDGQTDKSNAYCPLPYWDGGITRSPQMSQRCRATLRVIQYFAKSLTKRHPKSFEVTPLSIRRV